MMEQIATFFSMGGYAPFIWPSFGISALVLLALLGQTLRALRTAEAELSILDESGIEAATEATVDQFANAAGRAKS